MKKEETKEMLIKQLEESEEVVEKINQLLCQLKPVNIVFKRHSKPGYYWYRTADGGRIVLSLEQIRKIVDTPGATFNLVSYSFLKDLTELLKELPNTPKPQDLCSVCGQPLFKNEREYQRHLMEIASAVAHGKVTDPLQIFPRRRHPHCGQFMNAKREYEEKFLEMAAKKDALRRKGDEAGVRKLEEEWEKTVNSIVEKYKLTAEEKEMLWETNKNGKEGVE